MATVTSQANRSPRRSPSASTSSSAGKSAAISRPGVSKIRTTACARAQSCADIAQKSATSSGLSRWEKYSSEKVLNGPLAVSYSEAISGPTAAATRQSATSTRVSECEERCERR